MFPCCPWGGVPPLQELIELAERLGPGGPQGIAPEGEHMSIPGDEKGVWECGYGNVVIGMLLWEYGYWNVVIGMWLWECVL